MDRTTWKPFSLLTHTLLSLLAIFHLSLLFCVTCDSDYTSLVYHQCSDKNYTISAESHSQLLSSLFQELSTESSHSKFYKSTVGDHNLGISGLFQCRGDVDNKECNNCVSKLSDLSNSQCEQAVGARVQLRGCYLKYDTDGFSDETPNHELLHETCSEKKVANIAGLEEERSAAFAAVETEILSSEGWFYKIVNEHVDVVGQCQADLGPCDCGICISIAAQIAREDCGSSASGQVFYEMCFLSYSYHPDGNSDSGKGDASGKMIAIAMGGLAALFMGFIFCRFIRSSSNKGDV